MIETLQSLRFIFFVMIFMSHFSYGEVQAFDAGGDCGVSFFFMLSGYVLALSYADKLTASSFRWRGFMSRRMQKLYPLHLLCLAAAMLIGFRPQSVADSLWLVPNILLLQSWIPFPEFYFSGNAVSWFLSDILFCYAVFPVLCRFVNGVSRRVLMLTGTLLLLLYSVLLCAIPDSLTNPVLYVCPLLRLLDFAIGVSLCRIMGGGAVRRIIHFRGRAASTIAELIVVALLVSALMLYPQVSFKLRTASLFWLPSAAIILLFGCHDGRGLLARIFRAPILVRLGNSAFSLFMVHTLAIGVVMSVTERMSGSVPPSWQIVLCLSLALTFAGAFAAEVIIAKVTGILTNER
ncbi:MAG: acyltransferase family protein [Prevotella sp.]